MPTGTIDHSSLELCGMEQLSRVLGRAAGVLSERSLDRLGDREQAPVDEALAARFAARTAGAGR